MMVVEKQGVLEGIYIELRRTIQTSSVLDIIAYRSLGQSLADGSSESVIRTHRP